MLTERHSNVHATRHQIGNDLSQSLVTFVLCVMSHPISWADRNGTHKRAFDPSAVDVVAIYCPSPRTFVYLLADELPSTGVYLR